METNSKLLPETIYQLIKLVRHSGWKSREISEFLRNFMHVSQEWHAIALPLVLEYVSIDLAEGTAKRISTLNEILDIDPTYAGMVRRLKFGIFEGGEGMNSLEECGDNLLALVKRFTGLEHLLVDPRPAVHSWCCMDFNRLYTLPIQAWACFTHICSLPSLQVLDLRGLEYSPSIFIHHPGLEHLTLSYGYKWTQDPTTLTSTDTSRFAPLKSLRIILHSAMDKHELVTFITTKTLQRMLNNHPQVFQNLTSFEALSLVRNIDDIRTVLRVTRGTLEHFACGLIWQPLNAQRYDPSNSLSLTELENEFKLDLTSMSRLSSVELRYDSPESWSFHYTLPVVLSTLNTIRWPTIKKFKLILVVEDDSNTECQDSALEALCSPLDALIAQHTVESGQKADNQLDDIQLWILDDRGVTPKRVRSGVEGRAQFPLLNAQACHRAQMKLGCHIWENIWHPEAAMYLIGGWKMREHEEANYGIIVDSR